jgi:acylphosphatase
MSTAASAERSVHLLVSGRVQGVGFRYAAVERARELGLRGWTRNTSDGRVEIVAAGTGQALNDFVLWCHQGPPAARVSDVSSQPYRGSETLNEFAVRR